MVRLLIPSGRLKNTPLISPVIWPDDKDGTDTLIWMVPGVVVSDKVNLVDGAALVVFVPKSIVTLWPEATDGVLVVYEVVDVDVVVGVVVDVELLGLLTLAKAVVEKTKGNTNPATTNDLSKFNFIVVKPPKYG
jgi:hypothetical protein